MMKTRQYNYSFSLFLLGTLFILTGCLNQKKNVAEHNEHSMVDATRGEVLLSIDGKPIIYAHDFEEQTKMAMQNNPQLSFFLQMMPDAEYKFLFKNMAAGHVMKAWVEQHGLDKDPELVKQRQQYHEAIDLQIYMKYFEDAHPVEVTQAEAYEFYKAKRDQIPGLILSPEGVEILYVAFDTKEKAELFITKIKDGSEKHVKSAAKDLGLKVETMIVSQEAEVSQALKEVALQLTKFPAKELVKVDDTTYWVVSMLARKQAEYRSFDEQQIKDGIMKMCKDEKRDMQLAAQIEKLQAELHVVENLTYFENKQKNQAKAFEKADELVLQAQAQALQDQELAECDIELEN